MIGHAKTNSTLAKGSVKPYVEHDFNVPGTMEL